MEYFSKSLEDTQKIAQKVVGKLHAGDVLVLIGELGSGKTTFARYLVKALGATTRVQSPTFVIHRKYVSNEAIKVINHFDLYRMMSKEDAVDIGVLSVLNENEALCIIEWPEIIAENLPQKTIKISFEYLGDSERKIDVQNLY